MIVAEALAVGLVRHGVKVIFSQCFPIRTQHVLPKYGIRQIGFRTENAGGAMADGYARVSRHIAVLAAQSGPAATLLVPPLAEALTASVPLLALIEESPRTDADRNAFQEFDHFALFGGCAKWIRRVDRPDRLDDYLDMAITRATSGRPGPVVLLLPFDFLNEPAATSERRRVKLGHYPLDRCVPESNRIKEAAKVLVEAQRPIIICGGGVHSSGAANEVARLSAVGCIPVATTNMGKGTVDERAPLSLGVFGNTMGTGARTQSLRHFASEADVVLLVGSRTNANGTDSWRLFSPSAKFIHIDIDGSEVGRNYEALRLVGDAKATLNALLAELQETDFPHRQQTFQRIAAATKQARIDSEAHVNRIGPGKEGALRPEHLVRCLDSILVADDIVCADASYSTNWISSFISVRATGARIIEPRGLAGLGWGFPMAMGAKLARPKSRVFVLAGDGGFGHCWSELEAARRLNIPVVVIVLNNQILGFQKHGEEWAFKTHSDAADLGPVDHAAIARACDCFGERVTSPSEFASALERAIADGRPALLDVLTDENARPPLGMYDTTLAPDENVAV